MIDKEIREAFDQIHAEEKLCNLAFEATKKARNGSMLKFPVKRFMVAASFMACFFIAYYMYFTPTSVISIDINPSLELTVNRFNKIIDVVGYNDDGKVLKSSLNILYQNYQKAIETILTSDKVSDSLSKNEFLSIAVVKINKNQGEHILQFVTECTAEIKAHCYGVAYNDVSPAHSLGLSYGKYQVYIELQKYGFTIQPEEIADMKMRDLRDILYSVQASSEDDSELNQGAFEKGHKWAGRKNH